MKHNKDKEKDSKKEEAKKKDSVKQDKKKMAKESFDHVVNSLLVKYIFSEGPDEEESLPTNPTEIAKKKKEELAKKAKKPISPQDLKKAQIEAKANQEIKKIDKQS